MRRRNVSRSLVLLSGLGLVFIGLRFLLAPRAGAAGYGVSLPEQVNYAFHYAKGVRDVFSGLLLLVFAARGYDRPLGWALLLATAIPAVDLAVVLAQPTASWGLALPHAMAVALCLGLGVLFLAAPQPAASPTQNQPAA